MSQSDHSPRLLNARRRRVPLRLQVSAVLGVDRLDGAWWPQTTDLWLEAADLIDHFPPELGRIARISISGRAWDSGAARGRVPTARGGFVKITASRHDQTHTALVSLMDRSVLQLAVLPAGLTPEQGRRVTTAATTAGNRRSAVALLGDVA